ncbi:MAG TPA: Uma2 family endonuclease [Ktedonobacterales bacterium]|nr:Uma2 family endonuclease [Ktedonobacterales bacterium]
MSISRFDDTERAWAISAELRRKLLAALSDPDECRPMMTYEEFLDWLDEDTLAEWVDGKVIMASPASTRHQRIATFLLRVLSSFVELHDLGEVFAPPFQMKLERTRSGREPDVLYVASAHMDRVKATYLDGPADIVVEVISPESIGRDRGDKFYEYQKAGIPEYWLIDPETERAEFYQLNTKGAYQLIEPDAEGIYHSRILPRFWLRVAWLWEDRLPSVDDTMLAVGGETHARQMIARLQRDGFLNNSGE